MIKVLVTEDSPVVSGFLKHILNSDPDIEVVGIASNGEEAIKMASQKKPDVITMDIHMPKLDGFEATRKIMETNPVPIVICSASWNPEEVDKTFRTMEAGAVAALEKPRGLGHPDSEKSVKQLVQTVKLMSEVKVVRRWSRDRLKKRKAVVRRAEPQKSTKEVKVVAIGGSTGGPIVLQNIFSKISRDFPVPILIVQHIAEGFLEGLAEWLTRTTGFPVNIAEDRAEMKPAHAYISPVGVQMGVDKRSRIILEKDEVCKGGLCPSVSHLFRSVAEVFRDRSIGILLTGMGKDGAHELKMLRDRGSITIIQDRKSSVVYGMPGEAERIGAAQYILPADAIGKKLEDLIAK